MAEQGEYVSIDIDRLQIGLYVTLDLKWMEHQFLTSSFKIKTEKQLEELRHLGLKTIRYSPARSDCKPLPPQPRAAGPAPAPPPSAPVVTAEELAVIARKKERLLRLEKLRQSVTQCEKKFVEAAGTFKLINQNLYSRPEESVQAATMLVSRMAESLLIDKDLAIHAMNDKIAGEDVYFHSLNVSILAMMLAKEMGLAQAEIAAVGLGGLFHDIGKTRIPGRILNKVEPLTPAEHNFLAEHTRYGEEIGHTLKLPGPVLDIILHHHETMDGSGYPDRLDGASLPETTRIVTIVNAFDNLCNQPNPARSLTPYEAVSSMFAKQKHLYDPTALSVFIRSMGIYPPGTVVSLTDGIWAMVISVNMNQPLRPVVLIYDPEVAKEEAILINLQEEADLKIVKTYRPTELPREVFEYLSPRQRITYYFNEKDTGKARN
jgi:putative nucleotidyltransferase with HDIG domain